MKFLVDYGLYIVVALITVYSCFKVSKLAVLYSLVGINLVDMLRSIIEGDIGAVSMSSIGICVLVYLCIKKLEDIVTKVILLVSLLAGVLSAIFTPALNYLTKFDGDIITDLVAGFGSVVLRVIYFIVAFLLTLIVLKIVSLVLFKTQTSMGVQIYAIASFAWGYLFESGIKFVIGLSAIIACVLLILRNKKAGLYVPI